MIINKCDIPKQGRPLEEKMGKEDFAEELEVLASIYGDQVKSDSPHVITIRIMSGQKGTK